MKIYLASQSKGRLLVLTQAGYDVIPCPTDCDEQGSWQSVAQQVEDLAVRKMQAFLASGKYEDRSVPAVSSDTVVAIGNKIMGKAHNPQQAAEQLKELSKATHTVYSSYCVCLNGKLYHGYDSADVTFKDIDSLIPSYIESLEWQGAAGSYRLQGIGAQFIEKIDGDENTVIGLPLKKTEEILCRKN